MSMTMARLPDLMYKKLCWEQNMDTKNKHSP